MTSFRVIGGALVGALMSLHATAATVELSVVPQQATLQAGATTFVDVVASYDGIDRLVGGAFNLAFASDALEFVSVSVKAPHEIGVIAGTLDVSGSTGSINGIGFATFAGAAGKFTVATVEFRSKGIPGLSSLLASDANDPIYTWANESFAPMSITSVAGQISVVPEASSVQAMLVGLGCLAMARRRNAAWPVE